MGADMEMYVERLVHGAWQPAPEPEQKPCWPTDSPDRIIPVTPVDFGSFVCGHHKLYSLLAGAALGATCRDDIVPKLFSPRGFPADMNSLYVDVLIDWYERFEENFGVSWVMVCELVDIDLDNHEVFHCGYVKSALAPLFGDGQKKFPQDFPEGEKIHSRSILKPPLKDTVKVQWNIGTLRHYVEYSLQGLLTEKLLPLGPPDEVRIIYWFDW